MTSLQFNIDQLKPHVIVIQETKLKRKNQIEIKGYRQFPLIRGDNGGGVLISCLISLEPILVFEGDSECEILVVQITLNPGKSIRIIGGYGPQECAPLLVREKYRNTLEEQVERAYLNGSMVLVAEDANAKLGPDWIKNDPHSISENGLLLADMITRQNLSIVNMSDKCVGGPITRSRTVNGKVEASCIDYVLVSADLASQLIVATIDKEQLYVLTKYTNTKGGVSVKRSDHFTIISNFSVNWKEDKPKRVEVFKLRDEEGLSKFQSLTDKRTALNRCAENS